MKSRLFSSLARLLRLLLGAAVLVQGVFSNEIVLIAAGGVVVLMAVFNTGCCSTYACQIDRKDKTTKEEKDIYYEEVVK